jgi:hypothetical protein
MKALRRITCPVGAVLAAALGSGGAFAQTLGGGSDIELPLGRLLIGLVLCALIAFLAVFLLKRYNTSGRFLLSFGPNSATGNSTRRIRVLETHRLSQHADLCRFVSNETEYLVIVSQGGAVVLEETPAPAESQPQRPA